MKLRQGGRGARYSTQARVLFAVMEADGALSSEYKTIIDLTIRRFVAAGLWDKAAALSFAGHVANTYYNWNTATACTKVGSGSALAWTGTQGDGAQAQGFDTGITLSGHPKYLQDSATLWAWSLTNNSTSGADCGTGTSTRIIGRSSGNIAPRINTGSSASTYATVNSAGLLLGTRNAAGTVRSAHGSSISGDLAVASTGISAGTFKIGYAASSFSNRRIAAAGALLGLSNDEIVALNSIIADYMAYVGAAFSVDIILDEPSGAPVTSAIRVYHGRRVDLTGTMIGSSKTIEAKITESVAGTTVQVGGQDWNTIAASVSTGSFSGSLSLVPTGGPYKVELRFSDSSFQTSRIAGNFYVGHVETSEGESLGERQWRIVNSPDADLAGTFRFCGGPYGGWVPNGDAKVAGERGGPYGGDGAVRFLNLLYTALSKPVADVQLAVGGTTTSQWMQGGDAYSGTWGNNLYDFIIYAMTSASVKGAPGWNVASTHLALGINDAIAGVTKATYKANITAIIAGRRTDSGNASFVYMLRQPGRSTSASITDDVLNDIRQATLEINDTDANVYVPGNTCVHAIEDATGHMTDEAREIDAAWRARQSAKIAGIAATGAEGPKIASVAASANVAVVSVTHAGGTTLKDLSGSASGTGITGFRLRVDGTMRTITAAVLSAGTVRLTFSGAALAVGVSSLDVDYHYGRNPDVTNPVFDDDAVDGVTLYPGLPLQPSRGWMAATVS